MFHRIRQKLLILFLLQLPFSYGAIKTSAANLGFHIDSENFSRMNLNSTGLKIGTGQASANLDVSGNGVIDGGLTIGSNVMGSDNLNLHGSLAYSSFQTVDSATAVAGEHSMIFTDTSSTNIELTLPDPSTCEGRVYHVVRTQRDGRVTVRSASGNIDNYEIAQIRSPAWGYGSATLVSTENGWVTINSGDLSSFSVTEGLLAHYEFEGTDNSALEDNGQAETSGSILQHIMASNGNGTINGVASGNMSVQGKFGNAISLDGVDDMIVLKSLGNLQIGEGFSMTFWMRTDLADADNNDRFFLLEGKNSLDQLSIYYANNNVIKLNHKSNNKTTNFSISDSNNLSYPQLNDGSWHQIGYSWDTESGEVKAYVDGKIVGGGLASPWSEPTVKKLGFGGEVWNNTKNRRFIKIDVDDFRIYNRVLSIDEIVVLIDP
jgi:hypothetical protein